LKKQAFRKGIKMIARRGFTLVELLMVVLIIAILASIVVPRMTGAAAEANKSKCDANWANLVRALELYAAENEGDYPADQDAFDDDVLNSSTYFPYGAPVCPFGTPYAYVPATQTVTKHTTH
jgi:prepilin-type N-terminal cleavage/methylation domain-containing protein